jgi:hypothetical protein
MPNRFANRRSPSGPKTDQQLPYYNTIPVTAATRFVGVGGAAASATEAGTEYEIPVGGKLATLQVRNNAVGADAANATYQVRKNGANVGSPVVIANNAAGPVKVDLSAINVVAGDLVSISMATAAFAGAAPSARVFFSWTPTTSS